MGIPPHPQPLREHLIEYAFPHLPKNPIDMDNVTRASRENARVSAINVGDTLQGLFSVFCVIDGCRFMVEIIFHSVRRWAG